MKRLQQTIATCLRRGLGRERIAWAVAIGLALGIFPIYGPVSILGLSAAAVFGLNVPVLLAGIYSMALLKPLLILPFLRLGEWIFRTDPMGISLVELSRQFADAPLDTLGAFGWSFVHAFIGWLVVLPLLIPILHRACLLAVDRVEARARD